MIATIIRQLTTGAGAICCLLLCVCSAVCAEQPAPTETPLVVVLPEVLTRSTFDATGTAIIYPVRMAGSWYVKRNADPISHISIMQFSGNCQQPLLVTANGKAFAGVNSAGGKVRVVSTDTLGPLYDALLDGSLVLAPFGTQVCYVAQSAGKWYGICDIYALPTRTLTSKAYDEVHAGSARVSPDGRYLAFAARQGEKWGVVVRDGYQGRLPSGTPSLASELVTYEDVGAPLFSPDGSAIFYTACTQGHWQGIFRQGMITQCYEDIAPLVLSRDGMTLAYAVKQQAHWHLGKFAPLTPLKHAPDGSLPANQPYALMEYPAGKAYDELGTPVISPDSMRIAVPARTGDTWQMVEAPCVGKDEQAGPAYDAVGSPIFSADGRHLLYLARQHEQWLLVRDGQPLGTPADELRDPCFSPDGAHTLVAARREKQWMIARDGVPGRPQEVVGVPVFSTNGAHVAYVTARAGVCWVVVDGVNGPPYPGILRNTVFVDGPTAFHCIAYRPDPQPITQEMRYQLLRVDMSAQLP